MYTFWSQREDKTVNIAYAYNKCSKFCVINYNPDIVPIGETLSHAVLWMQILNEVKNLLKTTWCSTLTSWYTPGIF